jgi:lipid A 4'-phosphatase
MLLVPRKRWYWIGGGLVSGVLIGVARMSVGAHWLSDVLWALPITLATSWLVWNVLTNLYKHTPDDA